MWLCYTEICDIWAQYIAVYSLASQEGGVNVSEQIEEERERLLRIVEESLSETVREMLLTVRLTPPQAAVVVSTNELGSDNADPR